MDRTIVKELLAKHFGPPQDSLTLGRSRKQNTENRGCPREVYFYSLENEKELAEICDLLGKGFADRSVKLPKLTQSFPKKHAKNACSPQCAQFTEQNGGVWELEIYEITGVTYHRTLGGKAAVTLRLSKNPIVSLSDTSPDFYGYWAASWFSGRHTPTAEREGFSYWVNKALRTSGRFREFSADFFLAAAEEERLDILKDVAMTIRSCGCFLPPISYEKLRTCRTPDDVLRCFSTGKSTLSKSSVDLNVGYVMQMLASVVETQDLEKLAELDAKTVADAVTLPLFYETFRADLFLSEYYKSVFKRLGLPATQAEEYVRLCEKTGAKFRVGCGHSVFERHLQDLKEEQLVREFADLSE